jgi:uncharacterized membrane protein
MERIVGKLGRAMTVAVRLGSARREKTQPLIWWATYSAPLVAAGAGFVWILNTQLLRLYSVSAPSWDLGQTQQLLWSLGNGRGWTSSFEYGHNFLGIHLEPILLAVAAVDRLWPSPVVPLIFSAAGLAATAPAAFLMFRALLPPSRVSTWLAIGLAIPMPFWEATQQAAASQFHPENLALALAMLAVWAGLRAKPWVLWPLAVLVLSCKEDQTYTAFVVGLVVWRVGPPTIRAHGRRVMILAALWLVLGVGMFQFLIRGTGYSPDVAYYWWVANPAEPNYFLRDLLRPDAWLVLGGLVLSLAGLPLLAPRWLLLVIPPLLASLASSHDAQGRLAQHYVMIVMFPLIVAAAFGARRVLEMPSVRTRLSPAALLATALPALAIGFFAGELPPALRADSWLFTRTPAVDRLLTATSVIPPDAPVYADDGSAVWLANRDLIQVMGSDVPPDRYIVIDRQDWKHRKQASIARGDVIAILAASGRHLLVDDGRFQVWGPP